MKRHTFIIKYGLIFFFIIFCKESFSQNVAINDNGNPPNANAILDIDISTNDGGILIPRLTTAQRTGTFDDSFGASEEGLTVYDTDTKCYWVYDGSAWSRFSMGGDSWFLAGNSNTNPANDFIGTTDAKDLVFRTNNTEKARIESAGNFGIGTNTPNEKLEVNGSIRMTDGNEGVNKVMVSDANGTGSWSNETDGVKTRILRQINGGSSTEVTLYTHPENIEVRFNPGSELVTVENKSTDETHNWNCVITGGALGYNSVEATNYKFRNILDGAANDNVTFDLGTNSGGWFQIICADQNNERDGFILYVVYYDDDINGTVQYWDN